MKNTGLSWFAILFSLIILFLGISKTLVQHRKIKTFQPVNVTVLSTDIKQHRSANTRSGSTSTFEPVVYYTYEVNGMKYTNGDIFAISETGSSSWAVDIISNYRKGMQLTGYYNPVYPNDSILLPKYLFTPYLFTLIPLAIIVGGLFGLAWPDKFPQSIRKNRSGRFIIKPEAGLKKWRFLSSLAFLLWTVIGGASVMHYFGNASPPHQTVAIVFAVIYAAGVLGLLGYATHLAKMGKNVGDARLYTNTGKFRRGQSVKLEVQQAFKTDLLVKHAMVGIMITEIGGGGIRNKSQNITRTVYEEWLPGAENIRVPAKEVLSLSAKIDLPRDHKPGSRRNSGYPKYIWSFGYMLSTADGPDFKANYPVMVS